MPSLFLRTNKILEIFRINQKYKIQINFHEAAILILLNIKHEIKKKRNTKLFNQVLYAVLQK